MSATAKAESPLVDSQPARQSIARDGLVLPLIYGRGRAAVQWITPTLHWRFRNTSTSSYAFFSAIGVVCLGPIDEAVRIYVNGKVYHGLYTHRDSSPGDYMQSVLAKETPETFRLYWGTETQSASGITAYANSLVLNPGHPEAGAVHPAYRGQVLLGVKDMEGGQVTGGQTPALPNVEVEVYRRAPIAYSFGHVPQGTHPVGAIYEMLTEPRGGLALPSSLFDLSDWSDKMDRLMTEGAAGKVGEDLFISPVLAERRDASQYIADALSYLDGWLTYRNGKIGIDWYPNDGSTADPTGLRELSAHDAIGEPSLNPDGLDKLVSRVEVEGLDWLDGDDPLASATEVAQVPYAQELIGEPVSEKISRPWFITREQLRSLAAITAHLKATQRLSAQQSFRRESCTHPDGVTPLRPGDRFNYDWGPLNLDIVCRITERTESEDKAEVTLKFVSERGASPNPYIPPFDPRATIELPDPQAPAQFAVAEAPPDLELPAGTSIIPLVERADTYTGNYRLHFAPTNSWPGQVVLNDSRWSISGVVTAGLSNVGTPGTLTVTITSEEVGDLISQGATEQEDNTLLVYAGGEWLSVGAITPNGGGSYDVEVLRGRLGSSTRAITTSERVWFLYRDEIPIVHHANFLDVGIPYNGTTATKWFKVQAYTGAKEAAIGSSISLQLADRAPGVVTSLAATALAGAIRITFVYPNEDVAFARIYEAATNTKPANPSFFVPYPEATYTRTGLAAGSHRYYWVELDDAAGNVSASVVGPVDATALSSTDGADAYEVSLDMPAAFPVTDSSGTAIAGELGPGGRVRTNVAVNKGGAALTAVSGTPTAGEFRLSANGSPTNASATFSTSTIRLDTVTDDAGAIPFKLELEGVTTIRAFIWPVQRVKQGATGTSGNTVAPVYLYKRAATTPAVPSTTSTYTFASATLAGHDNGWTQTVPTTNGQPLWVIAATANGSGATDTIGSGEWSSPTKMAEDGAAGPSGLNQATVYLFQRATSAPSVPGSTLTFTFANGTLSGSLGSWSQTVPAGSNPVYVTTAVAIASAATDTISPGEWSSPTILAQNGATGSTGSYIVRRYMASATVPSTPPAVNAPSGWTLTRPAVPANQAMFVVEATFDGTTNNIIGVWSTPARESGSITFYATTAPTGIISAGDYWFDSDDNNKLYRYNGSTWDEVQKLVYAEDFGTGVRPVQLVASNPALPNASYPNGSVIFNTTSGKLFRNVSGTWSAAVPTSDLTGTIAAGQIAANAVTAGTIAANAVTAGTIAAGVVTATTVGTNQIIANSANIANGVITNAHISSLDVGKLTAGTVTVAISLGVGGEFSAGTGDAQLRATPSGTTIGNTSSRHIAFPAFASGTTEFQAKASGTAYVRIGAYDIGGGANAGSISVSSSLGNSLNIGSFGIDAGRITLSGSSAEIAAMNSGGTYQEFRWQRGVAIDGRGINFRIFDAGGTQKYRVDNTNGEVYIQLSRILSTRKTGWSTASGTATRTSFDTSSVSLPQLAERVKALIDDLHATAGHGLIGTT